MNDTIIKNALSYALGSDLHEAWRAPRKKEDGTFEYYVYEDGKNLRKIDKKELEDYLKSEGYTNQKSKEVIPGFDEDGDAR